MKQSRGRQLVSLMLTAAVISLALALAPGTGSVSAKAPGAKATPPAGATQKTIEGTIEAVRTDAPRPYIDVTVKEAAKGQPQSVRVPLGPAWLLDQIGVKLEAGQEVKLTGFQLPGGDLFVAFQVEIGGKNFILRPQPLGNPPANLRGGQAGRLRPPADPRTGWQRRIPSQGRALKFFAAQQKTLSGTISGAKLDALQPYIELKDADGNAAKVYVGPVWLLAQLGVKLAAGDEVKISAIQHGDFYRALAVEVGGQLYTLLPAGNMR